MGEAVHAIVVTKPGMHVEPAEIITFCRAQIAHYKAPKTCEVRSEELPKSGAWKNSRPICANRSDEHHAGNQLMHRADVVAHRNYLHRPRWRTMRRRGSATSRRLRVSMGNRSAQFMQQVIARP